MSANSRRFKKSSLVWSKGRVAALTIEERLDNLLQALARREADPTKAKPGEIARLQHNIEALSASIERTCRMEIAREQRTETQKSYFPVPSCPGKCDLCQKGSPRFYSATRSAAIHRVGDIQETWWCAEQQILTPEEHASAVMLRMRAA
jgi:NMD protein affecting ribosome stability and mRNA decay